MSGDRRPGGPQRPWDRRPPPREPPPLLQRRPYRSSPPPPPPPQRRPPSPPRIPRRRSWARRLVVLALLAVLAAAAGLAGGAVWLDSALQRAAVFTGYAERPAHGRGTTWLLVGSDSRADLTADQQQHLTTGGDLGNGRTDTMLLIHLPEAGSGSPATVVSIPRDSYVPIPGYGDDKVNAAFALGGAPLLTRTVEQATGLRLDHYVEIGFGGFAALVDALGGVTLCPDEPIDDPLAGLSLPAGCQKLAGRAALGYVRSRATPRADLDRMDHQRLFLSALVARIADPAVWLDPRRWYAVPHAAVHALTVDAGAGVLDLAALGWALRGPTMMLTVPVGESTYTDSGDAVVWDHRQAARLFEALSRDEPPEAGPDN
ncbi:LCP family protein [Mycolicibacter sinensis]|uniref:LCP family protein n=1 Tax=Mycolicibacter sinensis (strain JDM601) TaxID=875328 RepID=UPI0009EF05E4|nr:LCP family protein [Mycolicibacter sinensis]